MSLIMNTPIKTSLRVSLLASAISFALLTAISAQTPPINPAPTATTMPGTFYVAPAQSGDWMASDAMDEPVLNMQKEKIGEVNDLVVDSAGRILAAVVGIGGFLGLGEKDVAISFSAIRMTRNADGKTELMLDITKDALKAAPAYAPFTTAKRG